MSSLYQQILGARFESLDADVQRFHQLQGVHQLQGRCTIRGAESPVGKLICLLMKLPRQSDDVAFHFMMNASPDREIWIRRFPTRTMRSQLCCGLDGLIDEHIGPARLRFSLDVSEGQLSMQLMAIRILGLPWPTRWFPQVWAIERGGQNRFHFDVGAKFHKFGVLVAYSGHLNLPECKGES